MWKILYFHSEFPTVYTDQKINEYLSYRKEFYFVEKVLKMLFNDIFFENINQKLTIEKTQ